jgi:DNA-binding transcriptional LysR family regulator
MDLLLSMQVFRRVAELQSFSAAARDLRLSNAAISKHVAALEDRLRAKLILRTTRRMSLTAEGAAYYERCARILDDLGEAERSLAGAAAAPMGALRVNAPMSFGLLHVAPLVPEMLTRWPDVRLELGLTDRFVDVVEEGVDVVVRISAELPDSATLLVQRLARARQVVCASPAYLKKHGEPRAPEDLCGHDCIVYSLGRAPGAWDFEGPDGPARVSVQGRLVVNNSVVVRDVALAGHGIARLPQFYVGRELRSGRLRVVLAGYELPPLFVCAVYQRARHLSPKVRVFVDLLRERFAAADWAAR